MKWTSILFCILVANVTKTIRVFIQPAMSFKQSRVDVEATIPYKSYGQCQNPEKNLCLQVIRILRHDALNIFQFSAMF